MAQGREDAWEGGKGSDVLSCCYMGRAGFGSQESPASGCQLCHLLVEYRVACYFLSARVSCPRKWV